jgi:hypothetical protein
MSRRGRGLTSRSGGEVDLLLELLCNAKLALVRRYE